MNDEGRALTRSLGLVELNTRLHYGSQMRAGPALLLTGGHRLLGVDVLVEFKSIRLEGPT